MDLLAKWDSENVYTDGDEWIAKIIAALDQATSHIAVEMYMFCVDTTGSEVVDALKRAANRGVRVECIVDGVGSSDFILSEAPRLLSSPVLVRVYHPLPNQIFSSAFRQGARYRHLLRGLPQINRRNHRKVWIIDDKKAFVGSFNIGDFTRSSCVGGDCWREIGAEVSGPAVAELVASFSWGWQRSWRFHNSGRLGGPQWLARLKRSRAQSVQVQPSGLVRLNHRFTLRVQLHRDLLQRMHAAKQRLWICVAYFVPTRQMMRALADAAQRGVDVRIVTSHKSDVLIMPVVAALYWRTLVPKGVHVLVYQPSILHAKVMLIDDWLSIGSTNVNRRSWRHDVEADIVLTKDSTLAMVESAFTAVIEQSHPATDRDYFEFPWYLRIIARLALIMRRFL